MFHAPHPNQYYCTERGKQLVFTLSYRVEKCFHPSDRNETMSQRLSLFQCHLSRQLCRPYVSQWELFAVCWALNAAAWTSLLTWTIANRRQMYCGKGFFPTPSPPSQWTTWRRERIANRVALGGAAVPFRIIRPVTLIADYIMSIHNTERTELSVMQLKSPYNIFGRFI